MHSAAQHEGFGRLRPAPARSAAAGRHLRSNSRSNSKAGDPEWRGSGCGGRRKPIPGLGRGIHAADTPQPDPPRLRQISAICGDPRHAWMNLCRISKSGVRSVFQRKTDLTPDPMSFQDQSNRHRETVKGGAVWAGRTVGAMDGAIEPPWKGFTACPASPHRPAKPRQPRAALALAVAGQRPALPQVQGAALPTPSCARKRFH
jgi:hypothetical protein